jgi:hypothetical protein
MINKVIRASAGTGKTYRLSLEYISLLLRNREAGIHFSEILVITFTKRPRLKSAKDFHHLQTVARNRPMRSPAPQPGRDRWVPVNRSAPLLSAADPSGDADGKSRVQISTIDAFTNQIFKTVIAPSLGVTEYTIDPQAYQEYLAELYAYILGPDHLPKIRRLLERSAHRNITDYESYQTHSGKTMDFPLHRGASSDCGFGPGPGIAGAISGSFQSCKRK